MAKVSGKTPPLERMAPVVIGVVLAHVFLVALVGFGLPLFKSSMLAINAQHQPQRYWFSPTQIHMRMADQTESPKAVKGKDQVKSQRKSKVAAAAESPPSTVGKSAKDAPTTPAQEPKKVETVGEKPAVVSPPPKK